MPVGTIGTRKVTTVEGLGTAARPGDVQRGFLHEQAAQCGYCIPGMIARAEGLLRETVTPTEDEMRTAMAPSLCRCGTHMRILRAVRRAAIMRGGGVVVAAEPVT
jgi:nicotinate dehydrogenase subunit A